MNFIRPTIALLLTFTPMVLAAPAETPNVDVGSELLHITFALIGIVVLILSAGWFTRQLQMFSRPSKRRLRCLESIPVGVKERILLLEIGGTQMLIGVAPGSVRTLHVLDEPVAESAVDTKPASVFQQIMKRQPNSSGAP